MSVTGSASTVGMSVLKTVQSNREEFVDTVPVSGCEWTFADIDLSWSMFRRLRVNGGGTTFAGVSDEGGYTVWMTTPELEEVIRRFHGDVLVEHVVRQ
jgi:hypothetical protein